MVSSDIVVGVVGAMTILVAFAGVVMLESRAGPYTYELEPVVPGGGFTGNQRTVSAMGTTLADGACIPPLPATQCRPPEHHVTLNATGLPTVDPPLAYIAFLMGPDVLRLGPLQAADGAHLLTHSAATATVYDQLVVSIETVPDPDAPGPLVLIRHDLAADTGGDTLGFQGTYLAPLAGASGTLVLSQTGAVTVSALTTAEVDGLIDIPGLAYHAWMEADPGGTRIHLGTFGPGPDPSSGVLDSRVERLRLADQGRFIVTLGPAAATPDPSTALAVVEASL